MRGTRIYSTWIDQFLCTSSGAGENVDENNMMLTTAADSFCTIVASATHPKLAVLFCRDGWVYVGCASIQMDSSATTGTRCLPSKRISLAAGLATSSYSRGVNGQPSTNSRCNNGLLEQRTWNKFNENRTVVTFQGGCHGKSFVQTNNITSHLCDAVSHGMEILMEAVHVLPTVDKPLQNGSNCTSHKNLKKKPSLRLSDAYEKALVAVSKKVGKAVFTLDKESHHHSDDVNTTMFTEANSDQTKHHYDLVPSRFTDNVFEFVVKLILAKTATISTKAHQRSLQSDARIILQRLILSGKFSARYHLQQLLDGIRIDDSGTKRNRGRHSMAPSLLLLLQSLEYDNYKYEKDVSGSSYYSPVNMLMDVLDNCADITERQMVTFLRYMVTYAKSYDIAEYLLRESHLPTVSGSTIDDDNYLHIESYKKQLEEIVGTHPDQLSSEQKSFSQNLVLTGLKITFRKITSVAGFNEAILRGSICSTDIAQNELLLLNQMVTKYTTSPDMLGNEYTRDSAGRKSFQRSLQWLSVLRACQRSLVAPDGNSMKDTTDNTILQLQSTINNMEQLWSMYEKVPPSSYLHSNKDFQPTDELMDDEMSRTKMKKIARVTGKLDNNTFADPESCSYVLELL